MVDIAKIEKLMVLMAKHGFDVVQAESSGEKYSLARNASQSHIFHPNSSSSMSTSHLSSSQNSAPQNNAIDTLEPLPCTEKTPSESKPTPVGETMASPFVGTFYRSPSPDSSVFVEVGSKVKKGQALCIVEAMKLMNEIESEFDGEIVAILVENAKPVEFGTPLFLIAPQK